MGDPDKGIAAALPTTKHSVRFHDLRRTAAALSIAAGAHPKLISARARPLNDHHHARPLRALFPSVEEALADALDAAFAAPAEALNVREIARSRI